MVRGATARSVDDYSKGEWIWSWGGTSDINVIACRLQGSGPTSESPSGGAAYYHDAPVPNAAHAGQGHRFVACNFRSKNKYMVYLRHSNRDRFTNCYFEGRGAERSPYPMMKNDRLRTGSVRILACRFTHVDRTSEWHVNQTKEW